MYAIAARIDNFNFANQTIWEGTIKQGATFRYDQRHVPGDQYITEAANLTCIASTSYEFILSSHVLEHVANPLQALSEWTRVLKEQGLLVLVVPHRDGTFDHRRPVTSLAHMIEDFEQQTTEADLTHLEEILRLHDLARDPGAGDFQAFKQRSERNLQNRGQHHDKRSAKRSGCMWAGTAWCSSDLRARSDVDDEPGKPLSVAAAAELPSAACQACRW